MILNNKTDSYSSPNTIPQQIAQHLADRIIHGEYKIGQPLRILELSSKYSVSQTSVREALNILEKTYFLTESLPRKGYCVKGIADNEIYDVWEIKKLLWGYALRKFFEKWNGSEDDELFARGYTIFQNLITAAHNLDYEKAFVYNYNLSDYLIDSCGSRQLGELIRSIERQVQQLRYQSIRLDDNLAETERLMQLCFQSLTARDVEGFVCHFNEFLDMDCQTLLRHHQSKD